MPTQRVARIAVYEIPSAMTGKAYIAELVGHRMHGHGGTIPDALETLAGMLRDQDDARVIREECCEPRTLPVPEVLQDNQC